MVKIIATPTEVEAVGQPPKRIREYVGAVNTGDRAVSIAQMSSPAGWSEPGQTPRFDEYTLVLSGILRVETREGAHEVRAGQALVAPRGEWVRYSTPHAGGAEYVAVCLPAFTPDTVQRDAGQPDVESQNTESRVSRLIGRRRPSLRRGPRTGDRAPARPR